MTPFPAFLRCPSRCFRLCRSRFFQRLRRAAVPALIPLLAFSLSACSLPGLGAQNSRDGIIIASGNTTERQILAEMLAQMIRHDMPGVKISLINNLGSSILIHQAMMRGDLNVAGTMYTGTSLTGELGLPPVTEPKKAFDLVVKGYQERFHSTWYPSYGFENTYAFMITRELSERENIHTVSDLARMAGKLRAGVDTAWMKRKGDGYDAFLKTYGFRFKKVYPMEIGLVYSALKAGEMDVVLGYSTDGRINTYDLVLLKDDRHLFPPYDACPVATEEVLRRYPQLDGIIRKLCEKIDTAAMQRLNREADEQFIEPANVARQFLEAHRYFSGEDVKP